ncbi:ACP S-malonyltransferase [Citricoccus sp. SGAir0253]|uniref:ACP S-malonyltransferase n=1 Tax=Citricoccus sp. SGAir0253 TaxID=2567881 RepID=UPI0010CCBAC5|nr:ACP S-malonyltransferase [Citricoccus sp. SGAir0253]QCU78327.1 ACP S-malonyltransferase [Citricoccus sp. SGAir0253]
MLAIVCPGQGSQTPGFLTPWLELDGMAGLLDEWSTATGVDLTAHGTVSDEATIKDTAVAQPLIVAGGLLSARALGVEALEPRTWVAAGHSVGEITAAALAGVLPGAEALEFVRIRATGMAAAAAAEPTGMSAVLGGDPAEVSAAIEAHGLVAANANGGGQTVAAGSLGALAALAEQPPAKARVVPLKVAGAFHTPYMAPAVPDLAAYADGLRPADPAVALLSNRDGQAVASGREAVDRLVDQVTRPVRWDLCMESLRGAGVTGILELLPGGTLAGLAKRALKGTPTLAVKSPEDLDAARAFIAEHAVAAA